MLNANELINDYSTRLQSALATSDWSGANTLADDMLTCWKDGRRVFLCGNGGSAAIAAHAVTDFANASRCSSPLNFNTPGFAATTSLAKSSMYAP